MKNPLICYCWFILMYLATSCGNSNKKYSTAEYTNEVIDSVVSNKVETRQEKSSSIDYTAIGNIHMNTDEFQFQEEKDIFLNEHHVLGGLTIQSLEGFFYDNRLAAIEIISDQQEIHRKLLENEINEDGWYPMYHSKYQAADIRDKIRPFSLDDYARGRANGLSVFKNNQFLIEVSDVCDSPEGHNSFEDIINSPKKQCYGHNLMPLRKKNNANNVEKAVSIYSLLEELPKERAKRILNQYNFERDNINTDNLMYEIVSKNSIDEKYLNILIPEVQAHRNKLLNLHKNDPSWSFIIIYYKPLLQKYYQDQEKIKEKKKQEKNKELDII